MSQLKTFIIKSVALWKAFHFTQKEGLMKLIRSIFGRRQFLIAFVSSTLSLILGKFAKAFDLIFYTSSAVVFGKHESGEKRPLKGIVVYYSGTGNTAKIAGAIYRAMNSVIACDIALIKKCKTLGHIQV